MSSHCQVLIVGAGPVGMLLALMLHRSGVRVILTDKRNSSTTLPRAIAINQATLELFDELGLTKILQQGLKVPCIEVYWNNKRINTIDFKKSETKFPYFFHIQQSFVEYELESEIKKLGITYYRSKELVYFEQRARKVTATLKTKEKYENIDCDFLIGADGGQSQTCKLINAEITTKHYGAYFILADVELESNFTSSQYHFSVDGYSMLVPIAEEKTRLIFSFKGSSAMSELSLLNKDDIQKLLNKRITCAPKIKSLAWITQGDFGHKISNKMFENKVIVIGDAMHQFSPVGGTNMNFGLQDAFLLSKVLGYLILKDMTSYKEILEKFQDERIDKIKDHRHATEWFTALMTRTKLYPDNLCYSLASIKNHLLGFSK